MNNKGKKKELNKKLTIGAVILEPGSTLKNKTGGWRTERPEILQEKCIKCGVCWQDCPDAAIFRDKDGRFQINYDYCKGCGICVNSCPVKCIEMKLEKK